MSDVDYMEMFSGYAGNEGELIPILQDIQMKYGYISEEAIHKIAPFLKISEQSKKTIFQNKSMLRQGLPCLQVQKKLRPREISTCPIPRRIIHRLNFKIAFL